MGEFTGHLPGSTAYRRILIALFCAGIATFAQLYSTQAVLPFIADGYGVTPATAALSVSVATGGLAIAVIGWSSVADRIGRIPAMAIGVLAATVLGLATPFAPTLGVFLASRLLEGVALGAVPAIALAYLAEEIDGRHTASAAGSYIAGTTVGGLLGRLIAGPFGDWGHWRWGVFAVAVVCLVSAAIFIALIPRARGFTPGRERPHTGLSLSTKLARNLRDRRQLALYAQGFLLMGGFVAIYNYLGFRLLGPPFLLPLWAVSLLFLAYLAGTVASPRAGRLASEHGRRVVLLGSVAVMAAGLALTLVDALWAVMLGLLILTGGFFAAHSVASGWAPVIADPATRSQAASLYYLGYYAGSSLLGWVLGFAYSAAAWFGLVTGVLSLIALAAALATRWLPHSPAEAGE